MIPKKKKDPEMRFGAVYVPFRGGKSRRKFKIDDSLSDKFERIIALIKKNERR